MSLRFSRDGSASAWTTVDRFALSCALKEFSRDSFEFVEALPPNTDCAVVSSSGGLLKHSFGEEIDNHSFVIRFNDAPVRNFSSYVGTKTNYRHGWHCVPEEGEEGTCDRPTRLPESPPEISEAMSTLFPHHDGQSPASTDQLTSGFSGMLIALSNCASVDAYEITPSHAAIESSSTYSYYHAVGRADSNSWHGLMRAEHHLWSFLSDDDCSGGRAHFRGFQELDCPAEVPRLESLEEDVALLMSVLKDSRVAAS